MISFHVLFLKNHLAERKKKNPAYSLRALASHLKIDASGLSRILSGKENISLSLAHKVVKSIKVSDAEKRLFLLSVLQEKKKKMETELAAEINKVDLLPPIIDLMPEAFSAVDNFFDCAVLECTALDGFESNTGWIAETLGTTEELVEASIKKLLASNLLEYHERKLRKVSTLKEVKFHESIAQQYKDYQKSVFRHAISAIDHKEPDGSTVVTMIMASDPEKLREAKELVKRTVLELCDVFESAAHTQLYQVAFTIFPATLQKVNSAADSKA